MSLANGFVVNDQVKAKYCENCKSTSEALITNFNNPNLLLYGCKDSKCKHRLLRLDFNDDKSDISRARKEQTANTYQLGGLSV